jgi:hypothetical protein
MRTFFPSSGAGVNRFGGLIVVGVLMLLGLGIAMGATRTRQTDPPGA